MYSIVLVMALGNGVDAPMLRPADLDRADRSITGHVQYCHRRRNCHGGGGGCYGGGGGCHGGYGYGCHGGGGGCHGGYGYGCHGGGSASGCHGGGYYGPGYGAPPGNPPSGRPMPETIKPAPKPSGEEQEVMGPAPATIRVSMPEGATLSIDGNPTVTRDAVRTFVSPPLEPNRSFSYTLKSETVRDGKPLTQTKNVTVRAGKESQVEFAPDAN